MSALCSEIIDIVRKLAPEYLVVDGDNTGFLIGDENSEVDNVMVTLDINEEVIKEAAENKVGLIITHHPVIYNKLASITESDFMGRKIIKLIKNNITVYSAHSSLDVAENGINDYLAEIFELQQVSVMEKTYEMPSYEVYPLNIPAKVFGFGRIGILKNPVSLGELCNIVKEKLNLHSVNTVGYMDKIINKLGICSGSGGDLIPAAYKAGCDALLTGDIKYHDACDARDMGMAIIDAGHFGTENIYMDKLCHYINNEINKDKYKVNVLLSKSNKTPFKKS